MIHLLKLDFSIVPDWVWLIIVLMLLIIAITWIIYAASPKTIVTSEPNNPTTNTIVTDQYYFLPTASVLIKATAKVVVTKNAADNKISSASLSELSLDNTVNIESDTSVLFALRYTSSIFSNDEIRLSTTTTGLLENLSLTAEDRISQITQQIAEAPKTIFTQAKAAPAFISEISREFKEKPAGDIITQTVVYTNTFNVSPSELKQDSFTRPWVINVDGTEEEETTVDASFKCTFNGLQSFYPPMYTPIDGVVTHPVKRLKIHVHTKEDDGNGFKRAASHEFEILVPDTGTIIEVPIKRARFVKNQHMPKFTTGLLIENFISQPSEFEAALSIPINILKSIASIPGQLLNFKISHIQQQNSLETAQQTLDKTRLSRQTDNIGKEVLLLKAKVEAQQQLKELQDKIQQQEEMNAKQRAGSSLRTVIAEKFTPLLSQLQKTKGYQGYDIGDKLLINFEKGTVDNEIRDWLTENIGKDNFEIKESDKIEPHAGSTGNARL